jgi:hypothetical protein
MIRKYWTVYVFTSQRYEVDVQNKECNVVFNVVKPRKICSAVNRALLREVHMKFCMGTPKNDATQME